MSIETAEFIISNTDPAKCPAPTLPEYAFMGRSNVGKSSLINMLTERKNLAKISSTPGKTQLINHFLINEKWYLVDLPGYGFAKSSKENRKKWQIMIRKYLKDRINLMCTFILVDSRLEPQRPDLEMMQWFAENQLPFVLIFTKTDKLSRRQLSTNIERYNNILHQSWEALPDSFLSSSKLGIARDEILDYIDEVNKIYEKPV